MINFEFNIFISFCQALFNEIYMFTFSILFNNGSITWKLQILTFSDNLYFLWQFQTKFTKNRQSIKKIHDIL